MNSRLLLASLLTVSAAYAAELPAIPTGPIAKKKELLFSDDFEGTTLKKEWQPSVVPIFTLEKEVTNGVFKGTQVRFDTPAADGKPAIVGHQAVCGVDIPTKDSVIELRFKFAGAAGMSVEFDDRKFTGSHYGHICQTRITPKSVFMNDQKEGVMRNDIYEMKDPAKKAEKAKLLEGRNFTFPADIAPEKWHTMVVEVVGDVMRTSVDGKPIGYLKSPGIAHETKSKVEFGVQMKDGYFDDIKIYNAEPAK